MARQPDDVRKVYRHIANARRELVRGMERFMDITDPLPGHVAEAHRRVLAFRDTCDELIATLEKKD